MEVSKTLFYDPPVFRPAGDRGLLMEFGDQIDPAVNARIRAVADELTRERPHGVEEIIPTYRSLILVYSPMETTPKALMAHLTDVNAQVVDLPPPSPKIVELPVCYHPDLGPDLEALARRCQLSVDQVIERHTAPLYPIYMIGFTPGFPYLGGLDERLHAPRLRSPRLHVPAGSVGIANNQTGIYPIASPGGWRLIGRCPIKLFNPENENPVLLKAGNLLRFKAICLDEFNATKEVEA